VLWVKLPIPDIAIGLGLKYGIVTMDDVAPDWSKSAFDFELNKNTKPAKPLPYAQTGGLLIKIIMNKKLLLIAAIATCTIAAIVYIKAQPAPQTMCESLLWKVSEAKTQDEKDFAEKRYRDICITNQP
jgi:hypothetical protein